LSRTPRSGDELGGIVGYSDTAVCFHDVTGGIWDGIVEVA
jgi:hypothetical protein